MRPKLEQVRAAIKRGVPSGTFFAALEDELKGYDLRKGTVHFPLTEPVPVKLISRIAKLRAAGIGAAAKKTEPGRKSAMRKSAH